MQYKDVRGLSVYSCIHITDIMIHMGVPPRNILGHGVSTPVSISYSMCTTNSEQENTFDVHHDEWVGVDIRISWFPMDGFDTHWIPGSFPWVIVTVYHTYTR